MIVDREALARVCEQNDIIRLRVFGSFARGEATPESDIDLLADFGSAKGLFDLIQAEDDLTEVLGRPVDLLTEGGLSPYIKPHILRDARVFYERAA